MGVEGILGGHTPAHDGVQEGLPLPGIEAQHLDGQGVGRGGAENSGMGRKAYREEEAGRSVEKAGASSWDRTQRAEPRPGASPGPTSTRPRPWASLWPSSLHPCSIPRGSRVSSLFSGRGRGAGEGACRGAHLDIATHTGEKRRQGLVPVALQLPPGLSPSAWEAVPTQHSLEPRVS